MSYKKNPLIIVTLILLTCLSEITMAAAEGNSWIGKRGGPENPIKKHLNLIKQAINNALQKKTLITLDQNPENALTHLLEQINYRTDELYFEDDAERKELTTKVLDYLKEKQSHSGGNVKDKSTSLEKLFAQHNPLSEEEKRKRELDQQQAAEMAAQENTRKNRDALDKFFAERGYQNTTSKYIDEVVKDLLGQQVKYRKGKIVAQGLQNAIIACNRFLGQGEEQIKQIVTDYYTSKSCEARPAEDITPTPPAAAAAASEPTATGSAAATSRRRITIHEEANHVHEIPVRLQFNFEQESDLNEFLFYLHDMKQVLKHTDANFDEVINKIVVHLQSEAHGPRNYVYFENHDDSAKLEREVRTYL